MASSTDSSKAFDWWQATRSSPGHVQRDGCEFISFFVVLIEFENDLGSGRALRKAVQLRHFGIHEFDEPFVGVEFHGLNLYVHSLTVYKS